MHTLGQLNHTPAVQKRCCKDSQMLETVGCYSTIVAPCVVAGYETLKTGAKFRAFRSGWDSRLHFGGKGNTHINCVQVHRDPWLSRVLARQVRMRFLAPAVPAHARASMNVCIRP